MADKYQQTHIVLWDLLAIGGPNEVYRLVPAPAGFDWTHYPESVEMEGRKWRYVGTIDGEPYYLTVGVGRELKDD